ncbi:transposase, partial [Paenibacillus sp. MAEPY2]
ESKPTPSACPLCIRIGTAVIEVEPGFNPALLRDVVQALEAEC